MSNTVTNLPQLREVAEVVADLGVGAVEPATLAEIADLALAEGASQVLTEVLLDPDAPAVVRIRAFGRVALYAARPADFALAA